MEPSERDVVRPLDDLLVVQCLLTQWYVPLAQRVCKMEVIESLVARLKGVKAIKRHMAV